MLRSSTEDQGSNIRLSFIKTCQTHIDKISGRRKKEYFRLNGNGEWRTYSVNSQSLDGSGLQIAAFSDRRHTWRFQLSLSHCHIEGSTCGEMHSSEIKDCSRIPTTDIRAHVGSDYLANYGKMLIFTIIVGVSIVNSALGSKMLHYSQRYNVTCDRKD